MIALWYRNGAIEPAPWQDWRRHIRRVEYPQIDLSALDAKESEYLDLPVRTETGHLLRRDEVTLSDDWQKWPRAVRRWLARWGLSRGPGRRRAKPVPRGRWVPRPPIPRLEALLYLPEGESVEQRHCDDVERWLAARGMA